MILKSIKYSEFEDRPNAWFLEATELEKINLLVGRNAAGKTRTVNVIAGLSNLLSGLRPQLFDSGTYTAELEETDKSYLYELKILNKMVSSEKLTINGQEVISRSSDGRGFIFAEKFREPLEIKVPPNQIVAVSRRDEIQHPFLENLHRWASSVQHYQFGTSLGRENGIIVPDEQQISIDLRDNNQVTGMLMKGLREFGSAFKTDIIQDMLAVGYEISEVGVGPNPNISILVSGGFPIYLIYVMESDRAAQTFQNEMSQGMFRVLSLIIQVNYSHRVQHSSMILIDDIGEGLDYERSANIISLLAEKANRNQFQIIMSTNDKFVMNNVALKYWQIIKRTASTCKLLNNKNSEHIFRDFEVTGLSNFDFFSSGFYEKGFEQE